jgi:hypothetical protein
MSKELIKSYVSVLNICNKYGFDINRAGFIRCPFHGNDKHPSMKVYERTNTFKCFSCGVTLDIISFVERLFNIDFKTALKKINYDFNLGIDNKVDINKLKELKNRNEIKKQKIFKIDNETFKCCDIFRYCRNAIIAIENQINENNWEDKVYFQSCLRNKMELADIKIEYLDEIKRGIK